MYYETPPPHQVSFGTYIRSIRKEQALAVIRNKLEENGQGEPEVWANLGDILDWLDSLAVPENHPAGAKAALEIKGMLLERFVNATVVNSG